jgi:hypothetical protein
MSLFFFSAFDSWVLEPVTGNFTNYSGLLVEAMLLQLGPRLIESRRGTTS